MIDRGTSTQTATFYYESPLGLLSIGASETAVHSILFVKNEKPLTISTPPPAVVNKCKKELDEYFAGKRKTFEFSFRQFGTPFQESVWDELLNIPYGKTISYLELARRIGNTSAIRAVGTTNGKNQIVIVVPCHRVIGSNGHLTGYGGELWRKQWLLEHEARFENGIQTLFP